jgi:hypothetical protein
MVTVTARVQLVNPLAPRRVFPCVVPLPRWGALCRECGEARGVSCGAAHGVEWRQGREAFSIMKASLLVGTSNKKPSTKKA